MAVTTAAALTGAALYLNGKYLIHNDLQHLSQIRRVLAAPKLIAELEAKNELLIYHHLQAHAAANLPNHVFLQFEGRSWTYKQFYDDVQRVGNWLMSDLGINPGELVALDSTNTAEFLMLSLGLDAIGAVPAYINCNLNGASLEHCVKVCNAKYLLADRLVVDLVEPSRQTLESNGTKIVYFDQAFIAGLNDKASIPRTCTEGIQGSSVRCLVYTSGTTGLPKATILSASRLLVAGMGTASYLKLKQSDKMYTCLPLYHGAALSLCLAPCIVAGSSLILGRKFSNKTFWPEVSASGATILQYVGELCRYLVNSPPHPLERQHKLQSAWGNGMRPDVWERFRQRFNVPEIHELYAATDGVTSSFNRNCGEFTRGAIGVRGFMMRQLLGRVQMRAKIDPDTEDIVRGPDGFVVQCKAGEPGEVLQKVDPGMKAQAFRGYYNNEGSTNKRWMSNVLKKDDLYFRSGDVLREDADGRLYFVDRLGDTFRWKSENVSTNEVADTLGLSPQIAECSVYGVLVPHADGRAGCATVVLSEKTTLENLDLAALGQHVTSRLPRYAVPIFLRVAPSLSYTGTFKVQKGQAKREGIDLDLIEQSSADTVFWLPPGADTYERFTRNELKTLKEGVVRL